MAARALRGTPPTTTDSGWPTTPNAILLPDLASARTTILNDTLVVWGFEFSLPTTAINIVGIEVRIDGSKFETPGTDEWTLYFNVELNWAS